MGVSSFAFLALGLCGTGTLALSPPRTAFYDCNTTPDHVDFKVAKKGENGCMFAECCIWFEIDVGITSIKPARTAVPLSGAQQPRPQNSTCAPVVSRGTVHGKVAMTGDYELDYQCVFPMADGGTMRMATDLTAYPPHGPLGSCSFKEASGTFIECTYPSNHSVTAE